MEMNGQTIQDIFLENIKSGKEAGITFIDGKNRLEYLSYKKLYLQACYTLNALQAKGLEPGNEVVFQFQSNKNFLITFWACILGKFIPVPVVLGTTSDIVTKVNGIWDRLLSPYFITDVPQLKSIFQEFETGKESFINEVLANFIDFNELDYTQKATPASGNSSDLVFIQFSSGSTGLPKGVMNKQESIIYNIKTAERLCEIESTDKFLGWMPLTHDMGLVFFHLLPLLTNVDQVLMPPILFLSSPELWLESLDSEQITVSGSPNFGYAHVLENIDKANMTNTSFDKLRILINSAEPVSIDLCRRFEKSLAPYGLSKNTVNPAYGLAEAVLGVSLCFGKEEELNEYFLNRNNLNIGEKVEFLKESTVKVASFADLGTHDGTEIKITNEDNQILEDNMLGIIHLKSPAITSGYYNDPESTAHLICNDKWLNTGDIGFLHGERLVITGRKKEMIIINGQNYFPNDIDNIICELPELRFQQAFSCNIFNKDEQKDELFVFVKFDDTPKEFIPLRESIKQLISDRIGIIVKEVIPIDKIPKTTSGKIQRYKLKERYFQGHYDKLLIGSEESTESDKSNIKFLSKSQIESEIMSLIKDQINVENIVNTSNFFDLGFDSLNIVKLKARIEILIKEKMEDLALYKFTNAKDLTNHIYHDLIHKNSEPIFAESTNTVAAKNRMRHLIKSR